MRVLLLGATGTIGRATARSLLAAGHRVVCFVRHSNCAVDLKGTGTGLGSEDLQIRYGEVTSPQSFVRDGICSEHFDAVVSCLASRTGAPADAWKIDHDAHVSVLEAAKTAGIGHFILLSAICVQKPELAFQHAKLAFEQKLMATGLTYSIVRPTAYFKSLSGQVNRVRRGKAFLVFGDGQLTACKPISDRDLGDYIAACLTEPRHHNRILPIGGPGPAITPKQQGEMLFELLGRKPDFRHVPIALMDLAIKCLALAGLLSDKIAGKAELARIGRYYATQSMLAINPATGRYEEHLTPSTGTDTLSEHYAQLLKGETQTDLGDHAVF
jgi:divinyl chlorophyllide a 8-vinyl-reductase